MTTLSAATTPGDALVADHVALGYGDIRVVVDLGLGFSRGRITALVGANGSGKSTILKGLARILTPHTGAVLLDGKAIHAQPTREVARCLALLPQAPDAPRGLTVRELVGYGRFPHQAAWTGFGAAPNAEDRRLVAWALDVCGVAGLADRPLDSLSGGQRQCAWIAMAVAQNTGLLLLDEPTTHLDLAHQLEVFHLLHRLRDRSGTGIVVVLHDLTNAARFCDELVLISAGAVVARGTPRTVMTPDLLRRTFEVEGSLVDDPLTGAPVFLPHALAPITRPAT